jgi:predicted AAA+ superfamily ATPase
MAGRKRLFLVKPLSFDEFLILMVSEKGKKYILSFRLPTCLNDDSRVIKKMTHEQTKEEGFRSTLVPLTSA